ncbi:response regulator [Spirosoma oryzicola]|uniref:response regulator n=1 Tax=Spirosoma oryzicola TaxID=2898794 RepID=UPI001E47972E|nr:response regulator [Spirosoma oryzicola]UHG89568.1 response regulator [Spirosoma oryzicola]
MQQKATIWLVDDDEQVTDIIQRAFKLEQLTCQIVSFPSDTALLEAITQAASLPALLIVDYYLPGTDGLQLIQRLKENPSTSTLKTILFSQNLKSDVVFKAQELNVYQVTNKPTTFQEWRNFADELCLAGYFSSL